MYTVCSLFMDVVVGGGHGDEETIGKGVRFLSYRLVCGYFNSNPLTLAPFREKWI
jgi:hypothetical protein